MPSASRSRCADQQDGPVRSSGACSEGLSSIDNVAAIHLCGSSSKCYFFGGSTRLRLSAPCHPCLASIDNTGEPALFLGFICNSVNENHGIAMSFPAARQGKINLGELLGHLPKRKHIAAMWSQSQAAILRRDNRV